MTECTFEMTGLLQVTPSWWTDLWLNEGFASYVEYLGVEKTEPDMKLLEQFIITDLQVLFALVLLRNVLFAQICVIPPARNAP